MSGFELYQSPEWQAVLKLLNFGKDQLVVNMSVHLDREKEVTMDVTSLSPTSRETTTLHNKTYRTFQPPAKES